MIELRSGNETNVPVYSKNKAYAIGTELKVPKDIILIEGFLLFANKNIRDILNLKIYIDVDQETQGERRRIRAGTW